jgi:hypothetical protein
MPAQWNKVTVSSMARLELCIGELLRFEVLRDMTLGHWMSGSQHLEGKKIVPSKYQEPLTQ